MSKLADMVCFVKEEMEYRKMCSQAFKKCTYGSENKHKKFRILSNQASGSRTKGLISTVFCIILPEIIDAREQGYIPVVDFYKNNRVYPALQDREFWRKENAWEYYFTQPEKGVSLEEVWHSKYVEKQVRPYISRYRVLNSFPEWDSKMQYIRAALNQNIHLQKDIAQRVKAEKRKLFPQTNKVLGVGIRAGYRRGTLLGYPLYDKHPIVGSCKEYINSIEKKLTEWNYDSFFLAVDDRGYLEEIKKYFGSSCIHLERPRSHPFKNALLDIPNLDGDEDILIELKDISMRKRNEDYLVELYLLAQCDSLYATNGSGHIFSYLVNNGKYAKVEYDELGLFHYKG